MPVEGLPDWIEVASFWLGLALLALVVLISFAKWQRDRFRSDTAGRKVARLQCSLEGHDLEIIEVMSKGPVAITCTRCGKHWRVEPE